jgi:hypothetical protein
MYASEVFSGARAGAAGRAAGVEGAPLDAAGDSGRGAMVGWQAGASAPTSIAATSHRPHRRIALTSSTRPEAARPVKAESEGRALCPGGTL